jgi:hypothetical protein
MPLARLAEHASLLVVLNIGFVHLLYVNYLVDFAIYVFPYS